MNHKSELSSISLVFTLALMVSVPLFAAGGKENLWNKKLMRKLKSIKIRKIDKDSQNRFRRS